MNIYQDLFDLVHTYIFGGAELTSNMDLVATLCATLGSVFIIALPFAIPILFIKMLMGIGR